MQPTAGDEAGPAPSMVEVHDEWPLVDSTGDEWPQ